MKPGRIIGGKYRLRRQIGSGAMGAVWAAVHESLGRAVAVKFLSPTGVNPDTASARFVAEARMAAAVKHRFVVDIFDFGITEDGLSYMVLELLEGEELGERMYYGPPMSVKDAVRFIGACLSGLDKVHSAGIVHRDLKPENIFIIQDADGPYPKLLDFGISKMDADGAPMNGISLRPPRTGGGRPVQLTMPGTVIGTPWYMSPEQLRGVRNLDLRADIYSMGVILWEWVVGTVPYEDDNIGDLLVHALNAGPPDLSATRPELGHALRDVITRALATDREDRFQTAMEMRDALMALVDDLPQDFTIVQKSVVDKAAQDDAIIISEAPTGKIPDLALLRKLPPPPALGELAGIAGGSKATRLDATPAVAVKAGPDTLEEEVETIELLDASTTGNPALDRVLDKVAWVLPLVRARKQEATMAGGAVLLLMALSMMWAWEDAPEIEREVILPNAAAQLSAAGDAPTTPTGKQAAVTGGEPTTGDTADDMADDPDGDEKSEESRGFIFNLGFGTDHEDDEDDEGGEAAAGDATASDAGVGDAAVADTPKPVHKKKWKKRKKKRLFRSLDF